MFAVYKGLKVFHVFLIVFTQRTLYVSPVPLSNKMTELKSLAEQDDQTQILVVFWCCFTKYMHAVEYDSGICPSM